MQRSTDFRGPRFGVEKAMEPFIEATAQGPVTKLRQIRHARTGLPLYHAAVYGVHEDGRIELASEVLSYGEAFSQAEAMSQRYGNHWIKLPGPPGNGYIEMRKLIFVR